MIPAEILKKKRLNGELSDNEINFLIEGISNGDISDYQAAAFLTSSCINGLSNRETAALTLAMLHSGKIFDFSNDTDLPIVDKHSTGGVGDKISLLIAPLAMACGLAVPMISGRGLGHTGGTVDKLESVKGFQINLGEKKLHELMRSNNGFMVCQTSEIAPADGKLYHLRDVTGNVESVGLITASILSKKMAEGLDALVLDLKVGRGAFMQNMTDANELLQMMIGTAKLTNLKLNVVISSMEEPLGRAVGNWLEILEARDCLAMNDNSDIAILTKELACEMLKSGYPEMTDAEIKALVEEKWSSGEALSRFYKMLESQDGDFEMSRKNYENYQIYEYKAKRDGFIQSIHPYKIGMAGIEIKAGRKKAEDLIDYGAGFYFEKKRGEVVKQGDTILRIHTKLRQEASYYEALIGEAIIIGDYPSDKVDLILQKVYS